MKQGVLTGEWMGHQRAVLLAASALAFGGLVAQVKVAQADSFIEALKGGKVSANFRLRYENVDDSSPADDAHALTIRSRLGYETGDLAGWKLFGEMEDVTALDDAYNSTVNGKVGRAVVVDPEDTEVNQLFVSYSGLADTTMKLGRQRLILDGARFIGNVGWRQNEQTFDAFSVVNRSFADTTITYAYLSEAHRIFSDESPAGNSQMDSHLVNLSYTGLPLGTFTAYGYFLGFDDTQAIGPAAGQRTLGVSFSGKSAMSENASILYAVEYADQQDYDDGASIIDAEYTLAELGVAISGVTAKVGYEVLGGDGTYGFSTPLATLHKFQGWADRFLATPAAGIEDVYFSLGGTYMGVNLLAVYHDFEADDGGFDYGDEVDLQAVKNFGNHYTVGLKYADYDADQNAMNVGLPSVDAEKLWLWLEVAF